MSSRIHPSMTFARWVEDVDDEKWIGIPILVGIAIGIFPGGLALTAALHEPVWRAAGAERPYSFLIAVPAWLVCLMILTLLAWSVARGGMTTGPSRVGAVSAAIAIGGTAIVPAFLGTTGVLNGIGFALITLLFQAVWFVCSLVLVVALHVIVDGAAIDDE